MTPDEKGAARWWASSPNWANTVAGGHMLRALDRIDELEAALAFYAIEANWTQPTSYGGAIHDPESAAIRDGGILARRAMGEAS